MENPVAVKWVGKRGSITSTLDGVKYNFSDTMEVQVIPWLVLKNLVISTGGTFKEVVPCSPEDIIGKPEKDVEEVVKETEDKVFERTEEPEESPEVEIRKRGRPRKA